MPACIHKRRLIVTTLCFWSIIPFIYFVLFQSERTNTTTSAPPSFAKHILNAPIERSVIEHNATCKMPYINPFEPSLMKYFNKTYSDCTETNPVISYIDDAGYLHIECPINTTSPKYSTTSLKIWQEEGYPVRISSFSAPLLYMRPIRASSLAIRTSCGNYHNYHVFNRFNETVYQRAHSTVHSHSKHTKKISAMIIGIDSVSRNTFLRKMTRTVQFMRSTTQHNWKFFEFSSFNIVGDGTPAALIPLFTGKTEEELPEGRRNKPNRQKLDNWPWIWKDFKREGYVTLFAEDFCPGVFEYRLFGYNESITDHDMYEFFCAGMEKNTCIGSAWSPQYHMDYVRQFFENYGGVGRASYNHIRIAHDDPNKAQLVDGPLVSQLKHFTAHHTDTVLIVMSDHGTRYGPLRGTFEAKVEERLPALFIMIPPSLLEMFPEAQHFMKSNQHKLVTVFDLHKTLKHLMMLPDSYHSMWTRPDTYSLFGELVPDNRTCKDAYIPDHWCTCLAWERVELDEFTESLAEYAVQFLNNNTKNGRGVCEILFLSGVIGAEIQNVPSKVLTFEKLDSDGKPEFENSSQSVQQEKDKNFKVQFTVTPSDATFEAYVTVSPTQTKVTQVNRISEHKHMQKCRDETIREQHCVCKQVPHNSCLSVTLIRFKGLKGKPFSPLV